MAESNLLFIGAILSIALGSLSLHLIRKNENLEWNERLAAHILCWMFVVKGIQNAAVGYINELPMENDTENIWQFLYAMSMLLDHAFSFSIMALCLIYPVPLLRTARQLKIGFVVLMTILVFRVVLVLVGHPSSLLEFPGLIYIVSGIVWGTVYIKFRLIEPELRTESTQNIATVCSLFLILVMGHIWFWWPGMILQAEYFYFFDLGGVFTSITWDYMWQMALSLCIAIGLCLLAIEIYQSVQGNPNSSMMYILISYFIIGAIGYVILSNVESVHHAVEVEDTTKLAALCSTLTSQMHFTIVRPLIAMYILLKFGLFDITEENKSTAKIMAVILIVVATSAILELIQSIIPINEMVSAALLGIIIAFGIGWEERSFDKLVNNRANLRIDVEPKWFPKIKQSDKITSKIDLAYAVFIVIVTLISYLVWKTNMLLQIYWEKGGG